MTQSLSAVYKRKKEANEFINIQAEFQFVESALDSLSDIMMDINLSPSDPSYQKARMEHSYFIRQHDSMVDEVKRQKYMKDKGQPQRAYWAKNKDKINAQVKAQRHANKLKKDGINIINK